MIVLQEEVKAALEAADGQEDVALQQLCGAAADGGNQEDVVSLCKLKFVQN